MATFTAEDLEKLGIVNVGDAMTQIPQNVSGFTPANTGTSSFFVGSTLANLRGLNPFFGIVASPQALAYAFGDLTEHNDIRQDVVAASATGEL